jgi:hypothetical protein
LLEDTAHEIPSLYDVLGFGNYDIAGELFTWLLTNLETNAISSLNDSTADWRSAGVFRRFSTKEFITDVPSGEWSGLANNAYMYYPTNCITE